MYDNPDTLIQWGLVKILVCISTPCSIRVKLGLQRVHFLFSILRVNRKDYEKREISMISSGAPRGSACWARGGSPENPAWALTGAGSEPKSKNRIS